MIWKNYNVDAIILGRGINLANPNTNLKIGDTYNGTTV